MPRDKSSKLVRDVVAMNVLCRTNVPVTATIMVNHVALSSPNMKIFRFISSIAPYPQGYNGNIESSVFLYYK